MTPQETQLFEDEPALIRCLPQLNNLREVGRLTDLIIELKDNVQLHAHRVVFAARVPSLCDSLCENSTKKRPTILQWPTTSPNVASSFIDYIYTGQLEVHEANATGLILLSRQLEMPQVEEWAVTFMAARLDSENLATNWNLMQLLKSDALMNTCLQHTKATFEATVASEFFLQLPSDALLSLLRADDLAVNSEESVFEAIGRWISPLGKADKTRLVHAKALMKEVRWNQVDADFRNRLLDDDDDDESFWNKDVDCVRLLGRITKWIEIPSSRGDKQCPFNERSRESLGGSADSECSVSDQRRNPLERICLLGSSATGGEYFLTCYDADTNTSQLLTAITSGSRAVFLAVEDCVFAIGGYAGNERPTNVDKFDTKEHRWSECAPFRGWWADFTAVAVAVGEETVICVCGGGEGGIYGSYFASCLLYLPREDKWYNLPYLKLGRRCAAAVSLPDGRVFVIGGEIREKDDYNNRKFISSTSSVETCHLRGPGAWQGHLTTSDVFWKDAVHMLRPRKDPAAIVFRGKIVVAGGCDGGEHLKTVDVFSPPDNQQPLGQWTHLANWDTSVPSTALLVCQDRLFSFAVGSNRIREFVLPEGPSMPSRGKFDLWMWADRGTVDDFSSIQQAFLLREL